MLNRNATVKQEDVLLLLQRVLVLLGGASHSITQERRRIAWGRVNPANVLPDDQEESKEKEVTLFGGGFLEKATKRIEKAKELEKVTGSKRGGAPPQKRKYQDKDPQRLTSFFGERCPCKIQRREPCAPQAVQPAEEVPEPEERLQEAKQLGTVESLTHTCTNLLNSTISHTLCIAQLPMAGRLPHCLHNWQAVTSDPWVLQVVRGYKLDLVSLPVQRVPPSMSGTGRVDLVEEEVQKLLRKGAIKQCPIALVSSSVASSWCPRGMVHTDQWST